MQAAIAKNDTEKMDMIVKRVSVPIGLEELMEGLTKEVLLKKPKDLYIFASEYFSRLVTLREHSSHKAYTIRTMQSVTHLRTPDTTEKKKVPPPRPTKHLSRQISTQSKTPVQPKVSQVRRGTQKNEDRKPKEKTTKEAVEIPLRRDKSKESTPSVESTPREKRQRSRSRQTKSSVGDSKNSTEQSKPLKIQGRTKSDKKTAPKPPTLRSESERRNSSLKDVTKTTTKIASQPLDSDIWAATTNVHEVTKLIDMKKADIVEETKETDADKEKRFPETKDIETEKRKSPEGKEDNVGLSSEATTIESKPVRAATLKAETRAETVEPDHTDVRTGSIDEDSVVQLEKRKSSEHIEHTSSEKEDSGCGRKEELNELDSTDPKQENTIVGSEIDKELQHPDIEIENKIMNKPHESDNKTTSSADDTSTSSGINKLLNQPSTTNEIAKRVPDDALDSEAKITESVGDKESEHKTEVIDDNNVEVSMKTAQNDEINIVPHEGDEEKKKAGEHPILDNTTTVLSEDSTSDNKDPVSKKDLIEGKDDKNKEVNDNVKLVDTSLPQGSTASVNEDASSKEYSTSNEDVGMKKSDRDSTSEQSKLLVSRESKDSNHSSSNDTGSKEDSVESGGNNGQKKTSPSLDLVTESKDGVAFDSKYVEHKKNKEEPDTNIKKEAEAKNNNIGEIASADVKYRQQNINKDNSSIIAEVEDLSSGEHFDQVGTQMEDNIGAFKSTEEKRDIILDNQHNNEILEPKIDDFNSSLKDGKKNGFPEVTPKDTSSKVMVGGLDKTETHQESPTKDIKETSKKDVQIKMEQMGQSDDVLTISILDPSDSSEGSKEAPHDAQDKSVCDDVKEEPESKQDVGKPNIESGEKQQFFPTNEELVSKEGDKIEDNENKDKLDEKVTTKEELLKETDNDVNQSGKIMSDVISIEDHINKVKSEVTKKETKDEVKNSTVSTDSNGVETIANIASVDDHIDKPTPEGKYDKEKDKGEEETKNVVLLTKEESKGHSMDNDLTKQNSNYEMADAKTGRVHTPVKTLLSSFLANEKQHVFKTTDLGAGENVVKTVGNEEKIKINLPEENSNTNEIIPALGERNIKDEPCETVADFGEAAGGDVGKPFQEANNKIESDSILKQPIDIKSEVPATKKESRDLSSSRDSTEASNSLKLIIKEIDSSDGNTNTQSGITDRGEDKPNQLGYRKRRSITIDETNGTVSQVGSVQQASSNDICDLLSSETVADVPSITEVAVETKTSKNLDSNTDRGQNVEIETLQSVSSKENRLESGSTSFSGDKSVDNSQKEISLISSQDRKIESAEEQSGRKNTLEQTDTVDAQVEMSSLDSVEGKGINKENTFIKGDNEHISEVRAVSKRADVEKVASVIEVVKNIHDANSIADKNSVDAAKEFLNTFLQNEQQHVFRNADERKKLESNNLSDEKIDDEKDKKVVSNKKTKSKLAFGSKQLNNETGVSNVDNTKMRRAKSVGIIKIGEHESKSKIPTPVRRSAGRRPLVRQLDADSKELEEKLNFKRSSSGSSKENDAKESSRKQNGGIAARGGTETKLTKDDALIAKTILKGVEGAGKHIELIDEHLNRSVENNQTEALGPSTEQSGPNLSSKDGTSTKADKFDKHGQKIINQSKQENDEMEMDSLEIQSDKRQHDAATTIQKNWKGFHARKGLGQSKVDESDISPRDALEEEGVRIEIDKGENDNQKSIEIMQNKGNINDEDGGKDNKIGSESAELTEGKKSTVSDDSNQKEDVEKHIDSNRIIATEQEVTNNTDRIQSSVKPESLEDKPHVDSNKAEDMWPQIVPVQNERASKIIKDTEGDNFKGGGKVPSLELERNNHENRNDDSCTTSHSEKHAESNSSQSLPESKKDDLQEVTVPDQANRIEQKLITADYDGYVEKHAEPSLGKADLDRGKEEGYENKGRNIEVKQDDNSLSKKEEVLGANQSKSSEKFDEPKQKPIDLKQNENVEQVTDQVKNSDELDTDKIDLIKSNRPTSTPQAVESDTNNAIVSEQISKREIQDQRNFEISQSKSTNKSDEVNSDTFDKNKDDSRDASHVAHVLAQNLNTKVYDTEEGDKNKQDSVEVSRDANFPIVSNMTNESEKDSSNQTNDSNNINGIQEGSVLTKRVEPVAKYGSQNGSGGDGSNSVIEKSGENDVSIVKEEHVETKPVEGQIKSVEKFDVNKSAIVENFSEEERSNRVIENKDNGKSHIEPREGEKSIEKDQLKTEPHKNENADNIIEEEDSNRVSENKDNAIDERIEPRPREEKTRSASANVDKLRGIDERNSVSEHKDIGKSDESVVNVEKGKRIERRPGEDEQKSIESDQSNTVEKLHSNESANGENINEKERDNRVSENKDNDIDQKIGIGEYIQPKPSQEKKSIENDQIKTVDNAELNKRANVDKLIGMYERNIVPENRDNGKSDINNGSTEKERQMEARPSKDDKRSIENDQIKSSGELEISKSKNVGKASEVSQKQQEFSPRGAEGHMEVNSVTDQNQDTQQGTETAQKVDSTKGDHTKTVGSIEADQSKATELHSVKVGDENMEEHIESSRNTIVANAPSKGVAEQVDVNQSKKLEHIAGEETGGIGEADKVVENEIKVEPIGNSQTDPRAAKEEEANLKRKRQSPEEAAVKIQSAWKGFVVRKLMKTLKSQDPLIIAHEQAIIKVQAIVRGFLGRMRIEKIKSANLKVKENDKESTVTKTDDTDRDTAQNTNPTQNMVEPNTNKDEPENNILFSKEEKVADKSLIQTKSIKSDKGTTEFDNGSIKSPLEGEQVELNHHKGEMDVNYAVTKSDKSETNKQQVIATEAVEPPEVSKKDSAFPTGSSNNINKNNNAPEVDKDPMVADKIMESVAKPVGIKDAADSNGNNNKPDHTNSVLVDDNRPKRETNETVPTKDENVVKDVDKKYRSVDSTHTGTDSLNSTIGEPEIKSNTFGRPGSIYFQSNDLTTKAENGSKIGTMSEPTKDTQGSDSNENNNSPDNKSSSDKIDFFRSNTVEEPECTKKSISHLGEDSNNPPDEHHVVATGRKDDNNNSDKEETQLEKDVRFAVQNIMSHDANDGKHLTPLEAEVSQAVKQIMNNNGKTNEKHENISNVDNMGIIDTILKQLPEVPMHEVHQTIVKKEFTSSDVEQHVEKDEIHKANEGDSVKDENERTSDSSKSTMATPLSSKPSTTTNTNLANGSTYGSSTSLDAPDDRSSVGSVDSVVTVIMKPKQDANHTGAEVTEHGPPQDNVKVQNKRLTSKALSTSALEDHVELIDKVQNSLLDQLSGKAVDSANKFDIEELRKELHDAATLYKSEDDHSSVVGQDPEVMQYLYDFEPEDDHTYDSRMVRTPLRDLPDIAEETESKEEESHTPPDKGAQQGEEHFCGSSKLNSLAQASYSAAELITSQSKDVLHTSNSIVIPVCDGVSSEVLPSSASDLGKLKHTSEFHDTVVVPLPSEPKTQEESKDVPPERTVETCQANTMDSGNQTSIQQPPAGVEAVTSRRRPQQDGVDVARAQASLKDTSSAKLESGGSFTHQSPPQSPRTAEQAMESENNNNKRNNAINQSVTADEKNMEAAAATKIQAGFRGYQVRKQLKAKNSAIDQKRQLRKRSSRENMKDPELEEKSAVKIQAGVRGFLVRRRQKKQVNSSASA